MIGFLHPWVLAGLAAAAIPILLHLLARREPPTVVFPAVRYLVSTTREHQRRLKLQNWLLLFLRTLLLALLVMAAAGPTAPLRGVAGHAPGALVLIVDNSPSSGSMAGGSSQLAQLIAAARAVLARSTPDDALWLIAADGIPRRGDAALLGQLLAQLTVSPRRLALGTAITTAGEVLASERRPGEIVLLSDLQATALSPAVPSAPLLIGRPSAPPPANVGIGQIETGTQPWSSAGGRVSVVLVGDSASSVPVAAKLGDRPPRQALGRVGGVLALSVPGVPSGWWTLTTTLDPDEFRMDDERTAAVRVAPVARVRWDSTSRFIAAASEVLAANGRIVPGQEVTLGRLAPGASVVQPPNDPAELGALNRALGVRGVAWRYGDASTQSAFSDSGALVGRRRVARRYSLQSTASGRSGVLATVNGTPWIVRDGKVILLGSRLDPAWTDLPISAGFMPFMDVLLNRLARGEVALGHGAPGDPVALPDQVTTVRKGDREWRVEGGGMFQAPETGVFYLLAGRDTVGAMSVNPDPRESNLSRANDGEARRLWKGARVVALKDAAGDAFSTASRGDLRGPLLWLALVAGLTEVGLASAWRRRV
jgi:hypothetical protein